MQDPTPQPADEAATTEVPVAQGPMPAACRPGTPEAGVEARGRGEEAAPEPPQRRFRIPTDPPVV